MFCGLAKNAKGRPIGTPHGCMKKGIGIGMMIEQEKARQLGAIPPQVNNPIAIRQQMPEFNIINDDDMQNRLDLQGNFDLDMGFNIQPVVPNLRQQMRDAELARVQGELSEINNIEKINEILKRAIEYSKIVSLESIEKLQSDIKLVNDLFDNEPNDNKEESYLDVTRKLIKLLNDSLDKFYDSDEDEDDGVGYNLQEVPKPPVTKGVLNLRSKIKTLKKKKESKMLKNELEKIESAMELKQLLEDSEEAVDNPKFVERGLITNFREENEQLKRAFRVAKKKNQPFNLRFDMDSMTEQIKVFKERFPKEKKLLVVLQKMKSAIKQEEKKRESYKPK